MSKVIEKNNYIDVICQHTKDGNIIPMRIRIYDEDGLIQTFNIKSYKELTKRSDFLSPYGTIVHSNIWRFLCNIQVVNTLKQIELFYNATDNLWKIVDNRLK